MILMAQNRRRFLARLAATGAASLVDLPNSNAQDGQLETTTVRIGKIAGICVAPQYVAEELLRTEGFTAVEYIKTFGGGGIEKTLASGEASLSMHFAPSWIARRWARSPSRLIATC